MSKTIFITGASSGIGQSAAETFAARGWNVIATMPQIGAKEPLKSAKNTLVARVDVRDELSIRTAIAEGKARFGRIDALLSNAGFGQYGIFEAVPRDQIQDQFDVNVFGAMNVLRSILPEFRANGGGQILVTSSSGGIYGLLTMSLYITTKFALEGVFESVAYELRSLNIGVKLIEPGGVDTNFHTTSAARTFGAGSVDTYAAFYRNVSKAVEDIIAKHALTSADEVARVIYEAATDGVDQLRYVVGPDAASIIEARRSKHEPDFRRMIESEFGLRSGGASL